MKLAILGTGNMGRAIIAGVRRTFGNEADLIAWDANPKALQSVEGVSPVEPAAWFTGDKLPDAVLVAVKPYDLAAALSSLVQSAGNDAVKPLWISIAAGKSIATIGKSLPEGARVCRVMPNTPALIGKGMSAYALSENASEADIALAGKILGACGKAVAVPEKFINAVTGLSGSGPAYVFFFIESLVEAGVMAGLPLQVARECALQTVIGSAEMAAVSKDSLADLTMKVMTPGGTTAAGMMVLERQSFKDAVIKAVIAATRRSAELEG